MKRILLVLAVVSICTSGCSKQQINSLYSQLKNKCEFETFVDSKGNVSVTVKCDSVAYSSGSRKMPYNIERAIPTHIIMEQKKQERQKRSN